MPSKKKTTVDEALSTEKKGITKTNTTRTQKIAKKTKAANKRTAPVAKKTVAKKSTNKVVASKKETSSKKSSSTKKKIEDKELKTTAKKVATKKAPVKKATKASAAKKEVAKKEAKTTSKKVAAKKEPVKKTTKASATKKEVVKKEVKATPKKAVAKKEPVKKTTKASTAKKEVAKKEAKTTSKKTRTKKMASTDKIDSKTPLVEDFLTTEYYDLPFTYNKTVVKILAQTPEILFVYWDIAESDRKKYIKQFGENFFNETKPVLIITNKTMNYTFEVDINDFANSWYLHINDAKCEYSIELGRRPISQSINIPNNYLYVTSSNEIEAPNDHILFEKAQNMIYFRNVKTNVISSKAITSLSFLKNMGRIYNIYDFYKKIYKDEDFEDASKLMGNSSSVLK